MIKLIDAMQASKISKNALESNIDIYIGKLQEKIMIEIEKSASKGDFCAVFDLRAQRIFANHNNHSRDHIQEELIRNLDSLGYSVDLQNGLELLIDWNIINYTPSRALKRNKERPTLIVD